MPEGVEVNLLTKRIQKLKNCSINSISILSGRYSRHGNPKGFQQFNQSLPLKILNIHNKGKFIYFLLQNDWCIMITLGMAGTILIHENAQKHDHIKFSTNCGNFFFHDMRNFGTIEFSNNPTTLTNKLDKLGFDPLTEHITPSQFIALLGRFPQNKKIAELLLQQNFISGIGNYLRADILYCAQIHPLTLIENITPQHSKKLLQCIYSIMHRSLQKQQNEQLHKFLIYKQSTSPLGNPVETLKDKNNRTIWFVPKEQKLIS